MSTNKMNSRGKGFEGKKAWVWDYGQAKSKFKSLLQITGVFFGVGFIAFGTNPYASSLSHILILLGVIVSVVSMMRRDKLNPKSTVFKKVSADGVPLEEPRVIKDRVVKIVSYSLSSLGVGLSIGAWLYFNQRNSMFEITFPLGVVLSVFSRYNPKKHKIMAMIEDYLLYFLSFAGFTWLSNGLGMMLNSNIWGLVLTLCCLAITPSILVLRERVIFKKYAKDGWRNFFSVLTIALGLSMGFSGLVSLLGYVLGFPSPLSSVTAFFLLIYGYLVVFGGTILYDGRGLFSIKDLL